MLMTKIANMYYITEKSEFLQNQYLPLNQYVGQTLKFSALALASLKVTVQDEAYHAYK